MPITLPTELTAEHLSEVDRLSRIWFHRPSLGYGDYRGYTFLLAGLLATGAAIIEPKQYGGPEFWLAGIACMAFGGIILAFVYKGRQSRFRLRLAQFNQGVGVATIDADGFKYRMASGAEVTRPWSYYQRATIGTHTLLLFHAPRGRGFSILPLSTLERDERAALIATLQGHLGVRKTKEAPIRRSRPPQQSISQL